MVAWISRNIIRDTSGLDWEVERDSAGELHPLPYMTWNVLILFPVAGRLDTFVRVGAGEVVVKEWFDDVE